MGNLLILRSMEGPILVLICSFSMALGQMMGDGMYPAFGDPNSPFNGALARSGMAPNALGDTARLPTAMTNYPTMYPPSPQLPIGLHGRNNGGMMMNSPYGYPGGGMYRPGGAMAMMRSGAPDDYSNSGAFQSPYRYASPYENQERRRYGSDMFGEPPMAGRMMGGGDPMAAGMGGMGFMGRMGGMEGDGEGDGMADMFRMQAEMRQMQQQLQQQQRSPPMPDKANTTGKVQTLGDHILVTNQTRFVDNNDGMTQGFFQEFRIFPGMETTTPKSGQDERGRMDGGPIPAIAVDSNKAIVGGSAAKAGGLVSPTALFGFAPPDNFFNPRKVISLLSPKLASTDAYVAPKLPLPLPSAPSLTTDQATNHVALTAKPVSPVKKAFSAEKFDAIGDSFNRAFDAFN
ncbi:hypothetical protein RvY_18879 [Ramazzottius varieornatus]|uniref:Uncharacterized protein n=1 Tax=Ramazzottius varieornatus TaxID=947166 RepID=A0A1D1W7G0_RAMVA|nr:hypothetical protein RvY_18879 [Ramazzottius varieornatus]